MKLDLMLPIGRPFSQEEPKRIEQALSIGYSGFWLQEWPVGSGLPGHRDHGTGHDPLIYASHLANTYHAHISHIGFAIIRLDYRQPVVSARAIVSAQVFGGCPLLLGMGVKTTPETVAQVATTWRTIRALLYSRTEPDTFALPQDFIPPRMYLANSHPDVWEAIHYEAEGWLTTQLLPEFIQEKAQALARNLPELEIVLQLFCYLDPLDDDRLEMAKGMPLHIGSNRLQELLGYWSAAGVSRLIYVPAQTPSAEQLRLFVTIARCAP